MNRSRYREAWVEINGSHANPEKSCGERRVWDFDSIRHTITPGLSLALIGNASAGHFACGKNSIRGVFDKQTRRKPLAFAADAVRYGISTAVWVARAL
jgi:hypothetical protein